MTHLEALLLRQIRANMKGMDLQIEYLKSLDCSHDYVLQEEVRKGIEELEDVSMQTLLELREWRSMKEEK